MRPLVTLRHGTLGCEATRQGLQLVLQREDTTATLLLPRPNSGVGGLELVASRDERLAALFVFSGQSSQGYVVVTVEPELARVCGLDDVRGHGDAPVFSPSSGWIAMYVDADRRVRDGGEYFETVRDEDASLGVVVDWARLHVQRLPSGELHTVDVGVEIPLSTDLDVVDEWATYGSLVFTSEDALTLRMPWGEQVAVVLPPPSSITARGPAITPP